jgi:3-(3-hydroxy-phenyl)propionate hydroxylase
VTAASRRVVVVGAGPVGLFVALGLARAGIPVVLLEQEPALTVDLRAGSYHPPTLEALAPYGITDVMHEQGIVVRHWQIGDREHPDWIVTWDLGLLADVTPYPYRFHLEQHKLTPIIHRFLTAEPAAEIRFGARFTALAQDGERVRVSFEQGGATQTLEAAYLIGCDGGRSDVRHALGIPYEGYTWPERFFVLSTTDDLARHGFAMNAYVADPQEFVALFKMPGDGPEGLWRLLYPTDPDRPESDYNAPDKIQAWLQGFAPQAQPYTLRYNSFYRVHQRVAREFRVGRAILAGDAAHSNNPLGAFGLNSGIHDAANLIDKLVPVLRGEADETLLDRYARQRRTACVEHVQALSVRNKRTLEEKDPVVRRERFDELRRTAADPEAARRFLLDSSMISGIRRAAAVA